MFRVACVTALNLRVSILALLWLANCLVDFRISQLSFSPGRVRFGSVARFAVLVWRPFFTFIKK
jgi:hypothetical protein